MKGLSSSSSEPLRENPACEPGACRALGHDGACRKTVPPTGPTGNPTAQTPPAIAAMASQARRRRPVFTLERGARIAKATCRRSRRRARVVVAEIGNSSSPALCGKFGTRGPGRHYNASVTSPGNEAASADISLNALHPYRKHVRWSPVCNEGFAPSTGIPGNDLVFFPAPSPAWMRRLLSLFFFFLPFLS